jgi:hypothetical protein
MSDLIKTAPFPHIADVFPISGMLRRTGFFSRRHDRQQKVDRHAKSIGELSMKVYRPFTLVRFEVRQISLSDANGIRECRLCHLPPFAQHSNWILVCSKSSNDSFRQQDFMSGFHRCTRLPNQTSGSDILVRRQYCQALVFALGQNCEFLAAGRLDELNLGHVTFSFVDFPAMPDGDNHERIALGVENNSPVADPKSRAISALEPLHVSVPGPGECLKPRLKSSSHVRRKPQPLSRGRSGPNDFHCRDIAYSDIFVNSNIAYCDGVVAR